MSLMLTPVQEPRPVETTEPMPAARRPGMRRRGEPAPTETGCLDHDHGGDDRRTEQEGKPGEDPGNRDQLTECGGASLLTIRTSRKPMPPPIAIRELSGPSTTPSPMPATAARTTPGKGDRHGRGRLEALGRNVTAFARQPVDRERNDEAGDEQGWEAPPDRDRVEPQANWAGGRSRAALSGTASRLPRTGMRR